MGGQGECDSASIVIFLFIVEILFLIHDISPLFIKTGFHFWDSSRPGDESTSLAWWRINDAFRCDNADHYFGRSFYSEEKRAGSLKNFR
jgi:hypothetical protein